MARGPKTRVSPSVEGVEEYSDGAENVTFPEYHHRHQPSSAATPVGQVVFLSCVSVFRRMQLILGSEYS